MNCYACAAAVDEEADGKGKMFVRCMAEGPRKGRVVDTYINWRPTVLLSGAPMWCPKRSGENEI